MAYPLSGNSHTDNIHMWSVVAPLMAKLDIAARNGLVAVIKIDGLRDVDRLYSVIVTSSSSGDIVYRRDGGDLAQMLHEAVDACAKHK